MAKRAVWIARHCMTFVSNSAAINHCFVSSVETKIALTLMIQFIHILIQNSKLNITVQINAAPLIYIYNSCCKARFFHEWQSKQNINDPCDDSGIFSYAVQMDGCHEQVHIDMFSIKFVQHEPNLFWKVLELSVIDSATSYKYQ